MAAFEYIAIDRAGKSRKGVLEGDAPRAIRQQLREMGLTPLEVNAVSQRRIGKAGAGGRSSIHRESLSVTELALFTRQLATLVRAGLPLETSLQATAQQSENRQTQRVALGLRAKVVEGYSLAAALNEFPRVFPEIYRATVAAGESSGHLDGVLERLADYSESQHALRQKVQVALFYPAILTVVAIGVVTALMVKVVPDIVGVFQNIHATLPLLTRGLIAFSDFLKDWWLLILLAIIAGAVSFRMGLRRPTFRSKVDGVLLRIPIVARLVRSMNTGRFARTLSILVNSGVPVLEALRISGEVVGNLPMRHAIETATQRVREGGSIHRALSVGKLFPPITLHLIANGEASGELGEMLERAAQHQEREVETLVASLLGLFEPLLILTMGGIVLVIVLAILLPIFNLNTLVK